MQFQCALGARLRLARRTGPTVLLMIAAAASAEVVDEWHKLVPAEAVSGDGCGASVAISGDIVALGAPSDDCLAGGDCGAAYVFSFDGVTWQEDGKVTPAVRAQEAFGTAIAVDGAAMIVGAPGSGCPAGASCGAVYAFRFDGDTWIEEDTLLSTEPLEFAEFGAALALSGDWALIGAPGQDCPSGAQDCGAAYLFHFNGKAWEYQQALLSSDPEAAARFGTSVSIHGALSAVGGLSGADVFRFEDPTWAFEQALSGDDVSPSDQFGVPVAVLEDRVVVGSRLDNCSAGPDCGSAYLFAFDGQSWQELQKLEADHPLAADEFGAALGLSESAIVVGAHLTDTALDCKMDCGSAYLFRSDGQDWIEQRQLAPSDGVSLEAFGSTAAMDGGMIVIGAPAADCAAGSMCGAAYIFGVCKDSADCADVDGDDIRDDACMWWACDAASCEATDVIFADVGGLDGACGPDGAADLNDRFHVLNCFADQNTMGQAGYPCESLPPMAFNVDLATVGLPCQPDGICDGNDAFGPVNVFEGISTCTCPSGPGPAVTPRPPGRDGTARMRLVADRPRIRAGDTFQVHAFLDTAPDDVRGYQLHVRARGGRESSVQLFDMWIAPRPDAAFARLASWEAFNVQTAQLLAGVDGGGIRPEHPVYLATFGFRSQPDSRGRFVVDLLHDPRNRSERTFLFSADPGASIGIQTVPTVITVERQHGRSVR